jgi:hypothetical protein
MDPEKPAHKAPASGKDRGVALGSQADQLDDRLRQVAAEAGAGRQVEYAWELFRLQYFPGWKHTKVAGALGAWSQRKAIKLEFKVRKVHSLDVIFVVFTAQVGDGEQ